MLVPFSSETISKSAQLLRSGELVAFPTETVYGLGANALDDGAVKKIFALKNRPPTNPIIVHVPSVEKAFELIHPEADTKVIERFRKISRFWPGPLSLIVPKSNEISDLVSAGGSTIAIRIPRHPVALELLKAADLPIAAPSANKSFAVSPTTAQHVQESFSEESILIIDGGPCTVGLESTVLDISGAIPKIMRPGAISPEQIMHTLEETCLVSEVKVQDPAAEPLRSPGLFDLHYAPKTPLVFIDDLEQLKPVDKLGVILFSNKFQEKFANSAKRISLLSEDENLEQVARSLYREIRAFDGQNFDLIAIESCSDSGIGAAIMDRLRRARHLPQF